jgi:hypothetical protein
VRHEAGDVAFAIADASDGRERAIGIRLAIVRIDGAVRARVAEENLPVAFEVSQRLGVAEVVAFHVRDRDLQNLSGTRGAGERRIRVFHADVHLAAEKAQSLIAQHGTGKKSSFEKDLESVADAKNQSARFGKAVQRAHDRRKARDRSRAEIIAVGKAAWEQDGVVAGEIFRLVPDEIDRLANYRADGVKGVVIAIRPGKLNDPEFHAVILAWLGSANLTVRYSGGAEGRAMSATTTVPAAKTMMRDDAITVCAISALAWILAAVPHEGIGHGLTALATGTQSGVLSTVAWSSAHDTRLVAAGGTLVNLIEAAMLWLALRSARRASPQTRLFLFAACTFNLFTGTGYFLFSGLGNFGDWAMVIAGTHPHWLWRTLMVIGGTAGYYGAMRAMGTALVRYVGVPREDKPRMKRLTWMPYFSALAISLAGGLMNPLGLTLVLESALPAAAGGNAGLLWLRHYVLKGTVPVRETEGVERSFAWIGLAAALSLAFIFVLGRGITLQR